MAEGSKCLSRARGSHWLVLLQREERASTVAANVDSFLLFPFHHGHPNLPGETRETMLLSREMTCHQDKGRSALETLLVVSGAALPFPVAIHAAGAEGAGEEVSGARRHKITDSGRNVHPLVGHWRSGMDTKEKRGT